MRIYRFVSAAVGSVLMASVSAAAFAGCGFSNACPSVVNMPGRMDNLAPINSYNTNPYGYLKTFEYKNTPNVNTMRIRSMGLCGSGSPTCNARPMAMPRPIARPMMPVMPVMPAPIYRAPVMSAPIISSYNANRTPRQYGSTELVRGIAHIPTSIVDRSPITHIDGVPQPHVSSVTTTSGHYPSASPSYTASRSYVSAPVIARSAMPSPTAPRMGGNVIGHVNAGSYTYQAPGGGGQYWEKTSGPTMIGGMLATKVLCRREAPRPAPVRVNVVRPVIGVPHPVPTAVPVRMRPTCAPAPMMNVRSGLAGGPVQNNSRYGNRWTH